MFTVSPLYFSSGKLALPETDLIPQLLARDSKGPENMGLA